MHYNAARLETVETEGQGDNAIMAGTYTLLAPADEQAGEVYQGAVAAAPGRPR